jgi:hypothetical protein
MDQSIFAISVICAALCSRFVVDSRKLSELCEAPGIAQIVEQYAAL